MTIERELTALRSEIDGCDEQIRGLIERRVALVRKIAALKVSGGLPMHDSAREARILGHSDELECEIEQQLLHAVYTAIFKSGKRLWTAAARRTS